MKKYDKSSASSVLTPIFWAFSITFCLLIGVKLITSHLEMIVGRTLVIFFVVKIAWTFKSGSSKNFKSELIASTLDLSIRLMMYVV